MEFINRNKDKLILTVIFTLYCMIVIFVGIHHEPWADEAQSFLWAREYPVFELLLEKLKYEGHPIVWYLVLKFFLFLYPSPQKLYENIFVIPIVFSVLGMYLFLFKSKIPFVYKTLVPFTFFFLYQFSVFARNYSLVFPGLSVLAIFYKDRLKRPYLYSVLLIIFANISAYTFLLSFILLVCFAYDYLNKNIKNYKKYIPIVLVAIFLILTYLCFKKAPDCSFIASIDFGRINFSGLLALLDFAYYNTTSFLFVSLLQLFSVFAFYLVTIKMFCKNIKQTIFFCSVNFSIFFALISLYWNIWHCGYIITYLVFTIWILSEENSIEKIEVGKNKAFYFFTVLILLIQISWGIKSCVYDIKNDCCPSKAALKYILDKNLQEKNIASLGFYPVSILPYFDKNIFYNRAYVPNFFRTDIDEITWESIKNKKPNIIITDNNYVNITDLNVTIDYEKVFCAHLTAKGKALERNCLWIYHLK